MVGVVLLEQIFATLGLGLTKENGQALHEDVVEIAIVANHEPLNL